MELIHTTLFESELLTIRHAVARPPDSALAYAAADVVLMPIAGVFAKHDGSRQHVIANSNHALFLGCGKPYRISFPGDIGDESLVLQFSKDALARLLAETAGVEELYSPSLNGHCLLSPGTVLDRDLLWHGLNHGVASPLAIEELSVSMLAASVRAACKDDRGAARARHALTMSRRRRQVEIVKEVISLHPTQEWTLDALARQANTSPYHLARVFREEVGVPVYQYLIRTRLGKALEGMRMAGANLTDIALEAGFASHSHFSCSFRSLFGIPPSRLRELMRAGGGRGCVPGG